MHLTIAQIAGDPFSHRCAGGLRQRRRAPQFTGFQTSPARGSSAAGPVQTHPSCVPVFAQIVGNSSAEAAQQHARCFASRWQISMTSCGPGSPMESDAPPLARRHVGIESIIQRGDWLEQLLRSVDPDVQQDSPAAAMVLGRNCSMQGLQPTVNKSSCRRYHGAVISALISGASRTRPPADGGLHQSTSSRCFGSGSTASLSIAAIASAWFAPPFHASPDFPSGDRTDIRDNGDSFRFRRLALSCSGGSRDHPRFCRYDRAGRPICSYPDPLSSVAHNFCSRGC